MPNLGRRLVLVVCVLLAGPAAAEPVRLFADLRTEASDVFDPLPSFTAMGELAFFTASDGHHGEELWVSDGTPAGTRRITDICPGACDAAPGPLVAGDGRVFFLCHRQPLGS
ncbi:MAG: hypothetical protein HC897_03570 [Thermoanaerobaculia bacterium]|nr:hypothetical protein [Thermoanaerobaculia bacterium]